MTKVTTFSALDAQIFEEDSNEFLSPDETGCIWGSTFNAATQTLTAAINADGVTDTINFPIQGKTPLQYAAALGVFIATMKRDLAQDDAQRVAIRQDERDMAYGAWCP